MEIKKSLNLKFITGFSVLITPLVVLLFYITFHSINVIRTQVSQSNHNLLTMYIEEMDADLETVNNYLYKMICYNSDINSIDLYKYGDMDYILHKYGVMNTFTTDIRLYPNVDSFFVYVKQENDLTGTPKLTQGDDGPVRVQEIKEVISTSERKDWHIIKVGADTLLVRFLSLNNNVFVGSCQKIDNLMTNLKYIDLGEKGMVALVSSEGEPLTTNAMSQNLDFLKKMIQPQTKLLYQVLKNPNDQSNYLIIGEPSKWANMWMVAMIPEKSLLQSLNKLKWMVYILPVIMLLIVAFYITFLHKVLIKPMNYIVKGMKMVSRGNMDVKLPTNLKGEFSFITENFNDMMAQIRDLKINVYEEKIRTQQAEYKHLQLQISPHFYMNTLNIIYNLAALKEYKTVQKMALHLANHFRFTIQTRRAFVALADEINHTQNYLEIQKMRFPEKLSFDIQLAPEFGPYKIPPLTIQTFVENSIIHGFEKREDKLHIQVTTQYHENESEPYFKVTIRDNGKGFSPEILEELQSGRYFTQKGDSHIGIKNAVNRLKMKYENKINIRFENDIDKGAVIHLILPVNIKDDEGGLN